MKGIESKIDNLDEGLAERLKALEAENAELRRKLAALQAAEDELRRQKDLLQTIFDHIPIMINVTGVDGGMEIVNRAWERTLGLKLEDLHDENVATLTATFFRL